MSTEEKVIATLCGLPPDRQAEVLVFAEFLKARSPSAAQARPYGLCAGEIQVPDDFDAPLPESGFRLFKSLAGRPGPSACGDEVIITEDDEPLASLISQHQ